MHGRAYLGEVRREDAAVAQGAQARGHTAARAVAKHEQALRVARQALGVVAQVAHRSLQVHHRPRRAAGVLLARVAHVAAGATAEPRVHVHEALLQVRPQPIVRVRRRAALRGEARGVYGHDHGRGLRRERANPCVWRDLAAIGAPALLALEVGARDVYRKRLVAAGRRVRAVRKAQLVVAVVRLVVVPGGVIDRELLVLVQVDLHVLRLVRLPVAHAGGKPHGRRRPRKREEAPSAHVHSQLSSPWAIPGGRP